MALPRSTHCCDRLTYYGASVSPAAPLGLQTVSSRGPSEMGILLGARGSRELARILVPNDVVRGAAADGNDVERAVTVEVAHVDARNRDAAQIELALLPSAGIWQIAKDVLAHHPLTTTADHFVEAIVV